MIERNPFKGGKNEEAIKKNEFIIEKPQLKELTPDMRKRDSKIMGNLLGHLKKAQTVLQNQSGLVN